MPSRSKRTWTIPMKNVLSLDVVSKAEKIEKLAKKIRDSAKGLPDRASRFPETGATEAR